MYVACQEGHTDVVDLLVKTGVDIHLSTTEVYMYLLLPSHMYTCVEGNKDTTASTSSVHAYCMGNLFPLLERQHDVKHNVNLLKYFSIKSFKEGVVVIYMFIELVNLLHTCL